MPTTQAPAVRRASATHQRATDGQQLRVRQQPGMEDWLQPARAEEGPEPVQARLARGVIVEHQLFQLDTQGRRAAFTEKSLGRLPEIAIRTVQPLQQLVVALPPEVEPACGPPAPVTHAVEPAAVAVDPFGVARLASW